MTIRLTSVEAFEKVLETLKQDFAYDEETNAPFFKYCVPDIKKGIAKGDDERYLDAEWIPTYDKLVLRLRYHKRSDIMTDEEYLSVEKNDQLP